jgi:hypothetical protein
MKRKLSQGAVITTALAIAAETNYQCVKRKQISDRLGVKPPAINYYYRDEQTLHDAIMRAAVAHEHLGVIAQGVISNNPITKKASEQLRREAIQVFL